MQRGVLRPVSDADLGDYLALAFERDSAYGATILQVLLRRMRSALVGLTESLSSCPRIEAVQPFIAHLELVIDTPRRLTPRPRQMATRRIGRASDSREAGRGRPGSLISKILNAAL